MRFLALALVTGISLCTANAGAQDVVDVYGEHATVELENDQVRVIRMTIPEGYTTPVHTHDDPGVTINLTGRRTRRMADGVENSVEAHSASFSDPNTMPHRTEFLTAAHMIRVEIKQKGDQMLTVSAQNATNVDPEHHVVEFENELVRIVRMDYPAGHTTPMHDHLPGVNVVLTDIEAAGEDGNVTTTEAGTATWVDAAPPHVTKVAGPGFSLIRAEMKTALSGR